MSLQQEGKGGPDTSILAVETHDQAETQSD